MKKYLFLFFFSLLLTASFTELKAQCSVCTRTAQQLGEKPAKGLNAGILYLAFTPLLLISGIGLWWWKKEKAKQ
jgi:hypothetical protein